MKPFHIKHLISGGLITNYFCTSRCRHCLYNCGPHWEKNYIDRHIAEENFRIVHSFGCRAVHIGGGEPMLRPDALAEILELATLFGISITYVETNSSWFKDMASAEKILTMLRQKGLTTLLISISPFHNEFVPFSKVKGSIEACSRTGINVFPWVSDFIADLNSLDIHKTHSIEEFEDIFGRNYLSSVLHRYWVHMGGRALETFRPVLKQCSYQEILAKNPGGCAHELADTSHFHVDLFGSYIPGLCSGLAIAAKDLGKPIAAKEYPVLTTLFRAGVNGLYELASRAHGFVPKQSGYLNKCDLCIEIRTYLVQNRPDTWAELSPKRFYMDAR